MKTELHQIKEVISMLRTTKIECLAEKCFFSRRGQCSLKEIIILGNGKCEQFLMKNKG